MFIINDIINFFKFNIKFYLNIKNKLKSNLNIYINKFNYDKTKILYYLKNINSKILFNFRNKFNFNKSKYKFNKKTGKARLGYKSSSVLKEGLIWYGLRNKKLKKNRFDKNLLYNCLAHKYNILSFNNLEIIKFLYNISLNNINLYKKINKNCKNFILINYLKNYNKILTMKNNINIIY